jgi:hypothetical protein
MSLNDISLSSQLMAAWYPHVLVESDARAEAQLPAVPYTGRNEKNILIVVTEPATPALPDKELAFLTKVLSACGLGLADVAIVNWSKAPHQNAAALMKQFSAKSVILFDVSPESFGLAAGVSLYTVASFQDKQFVVAPALEEIEKTKEAKGKLWAALKQLFCI